MSWHPIPILVLSMQAAQPAGDDAPPDLGATAPATGRGTRDAALDAAYGTPSPGAREDPATTDGPAYSDQRRGGTADTTHRSTRRDVAPDGSEIGGYQIYGDEDDSGYAPQDVPDVHIVQDGDTLWDISGSYLSDPYLWPKLWSWNEHVTNAHWIFPGDRIRLYDPRDDRGRGGSRTDEGDYEFGKTRVPEKAIDETYSLNQTAFVDAAEFETSMKVIGGGEAAVLMSTYDTVYMSYDKDHPPIPGERLVTYAPIEKVYDIKDRKVIGYLVQIVGEVDVQSLAPKAAEGTIAFAQHPVERGYRVGPLRRTFKRVDTKTAEKSKVGIIAATVNDTGPIGLRSRKRRKSLLGDHVMVSEVEYVVMDIGSSSGVEVGHVLEVVRKGDEYQKKRILKIPYEKCWPRRVIGAVLVLQAHQHTSFGAAIYSRHEIERGDHVELRGRKPLPEDKEKCDEDDKKSKRREKRKGKAEADGKAEDGKAEGSFNVGGK
jgi:hypothetical protein